MWDIVYFVKDTPDNEELRYSLRSLSNFPHRRVCFYGGCPKGLIPDTHFKFEQNGRTKWENVNKMLRGACQSDLITKNFWLFNDDFFIMNKVLHPVNYFSGDLYKRIVQLEDKHGGITDYSSQLRKMCQELEALGCSSKNYAVHFPMLINRKKALELLNITDNPMFRSLYGNFANVKAEWTNDCKIISKDKEWKGSDYLSTEDKAFAEGIVGKQIRERFPDKCKYEL